MNPIKAQRVIEQPSFILHRYPHRETSMIVEAFTRDYGRVILVAKGAKRPHSALRSALQSFAPLALSWSGKNEMRTLTRADWIGGMPPLNGQGLLYGFYLNELILKFCAREDAHEKLFQHYTNALTHLACGAAIAPILRRFEYALLVETGHAIALNWCSIKQAPIEPEQDYLYDPTRGLCPVDQTLGLDQNGRVTHRAADSWPILRGQSLLDICADNYANATTVRQSKQLMRCLLHHYLQGTPLTTRKILIELHQ